MGLGDILGSLSPAYGLLSGQGLFGSKAMAPMFGVAGMAMNGGGLDGLFGGGGSTPQAQPAPQSGVLPGVPSVTSWGKQPVQVANDQMAMNVGNVPTMQDAMASLPSMASPSQSSSALAGIGNALGGSAGAGGGNYFAGLSQSQGQLMPAGMGTMLYRLGLL